MKRVLSTLCLCEISDSLKASCRLGIAHLCCHVSAHCAQSAGTSHLCMPHAKSTTGGSGELVRFMRAQHGPARQPASVYSSYRYGPSHRTTDLRQALAADQLHLGDNSDRDTQPVRTLV